jgi:hypothetical protein
VFAKASNEYKYEQTLQGIKDQWNRKTLIFEDLFKTPDFSVLIIKDIDGLKIELKESIEDLKIMVNLPFSINIESGIMEFVDKLKTMETTLDDWWEVQKYILHL